MCVGILVQFAHRYRSVECFVVWIKKEKKLYFIFFSDGRTLCLIKKNKKKEK